MRTTDLLLRLLYLVNLMEPVSNASLEGEFQKFVKKSELKEDAPTYKSLLEMLKKRDLVIEKKARFSVTYQGLMQIAIAGLSRARDKNRLFILKGML
jgi:hypothetical protein